MTVTRNKRDGRLILQDGSGTPKELEVLFAEGDFTASEKTNIEQIKVRGVLINLRKGDDEAVAISFSVKFTEWTSSDDNVTSIVDAMKGRGSAGPGQPNEWISTNPDNCDLFFTRLIYDIKDTCNEEVYERFIFDQFVGEDISINEGDETTLSVSGIALQSEITSTRVTP